MISDFLAKCACVQNFNCCKVRLSQLFWLFALVICIGTGCTVRPPQRVLDDVRKDTSLALLPKPAEQKIRIGDQLLVVVSSLNPSEDEIFNKPGSSIFEVQSDGSISYHRLGAFLVNGLTRRELSRKLASSLQPYLKDPIVSVKFHNHRATVLLDNAPHTINMPEEDLSLFEGLSALPMSNGRVLGYQFSDLTIVRENPQTGQRTVKQVDITKQGSTFDPAFYFLQPNDLVIIRSDEKLYVQEEKRKRFGSVFGYVLTGVNLFLIVGLNLFR